MPEKVYCKFGNEDDPSEVYVVRNDNGDLLCRLCSLTDCDDLEFESVQAMLTHLHTHEADGHSVPLKAFQALRDELKESV